jgi:LAS superfamily LD-carboxypeptidase LdcB
LANYIAGKLASPGYSLHNNGLAIDFVTTENGKKFKIETSKKGELEKAWRETWFFNWFLHGKPKNASSFGFFQNNEINEPWHWEYKQVSHVNREA